MNTTELVFEIRPKKIIKARTGFEPMTSQAAQAHVSRKSHR